MKKQLFLMGLFLSALTASAQNTNLKGVFLKDVMGTKSNTIFIAQSSAHVTKHKFLSSPIAFIPKLFIDFLYKSVLINLPHT